MKRIVLPIVLAMLGMTLLIGCFYLPVIPHPTDHTDQGKIIDAVGDKTSKRLFRVGEVTRAQVLAFAPWPMMATLDGKSLLYSSPGVTGYWIWPLCFSADPQREDFYIRLNFDAAGVLRSYIVGHGQEFVQRRCADMVVPYDRVR